MDKSKYTYPAFISYSHRDEKWARWLHKSLENFSIPKKFLENNSSLAMSHERIFPVFLDREELSSSPNLGKSIEAALEESQFLIVICSTSSAQSRWVNQEIVKFQDLGRSKNVLALIIDGEPNSRQAGKDDSEECFPAALRAASPSDLETGTYFEPLAADLRPGGDGKSKAKIKLISGLLGLGFDELWQREKRKRIRTKVWSSFALVMLSMIGSLVSMSVIHDIEEQEEALLVTETEKLIQASENAYHSGRFHLAALYALEALPGIYGGQRPLSSKAEDLLMKAVYGVDIELVIPFVEKEIPPRFSKDGSRFVRTVDSKSIEVVDTATLSMIKKIELSESAADVSLSSDGLELLVDTFFSMVSYNLESAVPEPVEQIDPSGVWVRTRLHNEYLIEVSEKEIWITTADDHQLTTSIKCSDEYWEAILSDDDSYIYCLTESYVTVWSVDTQQEIFRRKLPEAFTDSLITPFGKMAIVNEGTGFIELSEVRTGRVFYSKSPKLERKVGTDSSTNKDDHIDEVIISVDYAPDALSFSESMEQLLIQVPYQPVELWNLQSEEKTMSFENGVVTLDSSGRYVMVVKGRDLAVWDTRTATQVRNIEVPFSIENSSIVGGDKVAIITDSGLAFLSSLETSSFPFFSWTGRSVIAAESRSQLLDTSLFVRALESIHDVDSAVSSSIFGKNSSYDSLIAKGQSILGVLERNGQEYALLASTEDVQLVNLASQKVEVTYPAVAEGKFRSILDASASKLMLVDSEGPGYLFEVSTGSEIRWNEGEAPWLLGMSSDGNYYLLFSPDEPARLVSSHDGLSIIPSELDALYALFIENRSKILVISADETMHIFDYEQGEVTHSINYPFEIWDSTILIDPTATHIVLIDVYHDIRIWEISSGTLVAKVEPNGIPVSERMETSFSPDGLRFLTTDGQIFQVWTVHTGELLLTGSFNEKVDSALLGNDFILALEDDGLEKTIVHFLPGLAGDALQKKAISTLPESIRCMADERRKHHSLAPMTANQRLTLGCSSGL